MRQNQKKMGTNKDKRKAEPGLPFPGLGLDSVISTFLLAGP